MMNDRLIGGAPNQQPHNGLGPGAHGARRWLVTGISLLVAAIASIAFLVEGLVAPAYTSVTSSGSSSSDAVVVTKSSSTLVAENGTWVIALLVLPLLATVVVAIASLGRARLPAVVVAWVATGVLGLFAMAAMFTIGMFAVPVAAALVVTCIDLTLKHIDARFPLPQIQA